MLIVSGFNSPLNPEHVVFYHRSILPLHSLPQLPVFSAPLQELIVKYISKSGFLLDPAIDFLIKHWPTAHRQKQGIFLKELEALLIEFEIHVTAQMAASVFRLVGEATMNENSDVADIAIDIIMNPSLAFTLKTHASTVYPLIMEPAYRATRKHWDSCIRANAFVALQTLSELDQSTFARV